RVGGRERDRPAGWTEKVLKTLDKITFRGGEVDALLTRNRIFVDRMKGTGVITSVDAMDFGFTGPCLRACGINYDVRKARPYWVYDQLNFDVPLGENGDNFDRYLMRIEESKQSERMIRQAFQQIPEGPGIVGDWRIALPPKPEAYGRIEAAMAHSKLHMEGMQVRSGYLS